MATLLGRLAAAALVAAALLGVGVQFMDMAATSPIDPEDGQRRDYRDRLWGTSYGGDSRAWWAEVCEDGGRCEDPPGATKLRLAGPVTVLGVVVAVAAAIGAGMGGGRRAGAVAASAGVLLLGAALLFLAGVDDWQRHFDAGLKARAQEAGLGADAPLGFDPQLASGLWLLVVAAALALVASLWLSFQVDPTRIRKRRARGPRYKFAMRERKTFEPAEPKKAEDEALDPRDLA